MGACSFRILRFAIGCLLITGCVTPQRQRSERQAGDDAQRPQSSAQAVPLFVHLIAPRYYTEQPIPPKRIVTTRISIGEDFAVSFDEASFAHSYSVGGPDPYSYSGDAVLAGRVEKRGAKFLAHLIGLSHSTVNVFAGELELEKPVESQGGGFSGGIYRVWFVLSTNAQASAFLLERQGEP